MRRSPVLMPGQGHAALDTLEDVAAEETEEGPGVAPAVQKEQGLLAAGEHAFQGRQQGPGDDLAGRPAALGLQIDEMNLRQGLGGDPAGQVEIAVFAGPGLVVSGDLGSGGDQDHRGGRELAAVKGHVPGLIEQAAFLLVGRVVLLVHHHQPQAGQRGEDRGAGPHHHVHLSQDEAAPLVQAGRLGEAAVQHGDPGAEALPEGLGHGVGQGDFRQQHQDLAAPDQGFLGRGQVDRGLAAGGDAVEQERGEGAGGEAGGDGHQGLGLVRHQGQGRFFQGQRPALQGVL